MGALAAADRAKIERLLSVARATRPLPAPDGSLYFASNRAGHSQVYRQRAPGQEPELVFEGETRMVPHAHTPSGLLVREDRGGNEIWQLGLLADGRYRPLTSDLEAIHEGVTLHPDGRRVGLSLNPGGQANMVLGELDLASGEMTRWAEPGGYWRWDAWSPDGSRAAVTKLMGTSTETCILDRDGALTRLLATALRVFPVAWLDGGILVITDGGRDFMGLAFIDPAKPDAVLRWLIEEDHDVEGAVVDRDATRTAVVVNEGIYDSVRIVDFTGGVERVELPPGVDRKSVV